MENTETDIYFYSHEIVFKEFSNFYPAEIMVDWKIWPTVEHYYQAMKSDSPLIQEQVRKAHRPGQAKRMGITVTIREGWEGIKEEVMLKALRAKFSLPHFRKVLLSTGDKRLHEDSPTDKYWGVKGKDRLGLLLMQVREEIKRGEGHRPPTVTFN